MSSSNSRPSSKIASAPRRNDRSGQLGDKHFRRLLDKLPAAAYMCDAEGLITYFNQRAVDAWGRAPMLNDPVDRFCGSFKLYKTDGTPVDHSACWMALALKNERDYIGCEIVIERSDGSRLIAQAHASPIHDDFGRLIGAVNMLVDITERKRTEETLKRADRAKNEFLAMLSHELRNPLAPMRNALAVLRKKGVKEQEGRRALDVFDRQIHQLKHIIDDLLDVSRISDGKLELQTSRIELADVVEAALEISRPVIDDAGHELSVSVPQETLYLEGDVHRLTQALSNVLNNAATYTPRGGKIRLVIGREEDDVVISVTDDGIGIPNDKLDGIFEIFSQADHAPDRTHDGLGIGLALTRRVLEMHDGTIAARSEGSGKGSTFELRLPVLDAAPAEKAVAKPEAVQNGHAHPTPGHRILIVDDNPDVIESMSMLLDIMNIDVKTARSGVEAIDMAETYRPSVILMDIGMPGMDGLECARAIRQKPWGKTPNLIAVTGWGQEADIQRSRDAGFDDHIVKPMDPDALIQLLSSNGVA